MALGEREREVLQTLYYYACDCRVRVLRNSGLERNYRSFISLLSHLGSRRRSVTGVTLSGIPPALVTLDPVRSYQMFPRGLRSERSPERAGSTPVDPCRPSSLPLAGCACPPSAVSSRLSSPRSSLPRPSSRRADTALAKNWDSANSRGEAVGYSRVHDF